MKKIEMLFYSTPPTDEGMKFVLWKITDSAGVETHDWGFAFWNGNDWDGAEVPDGYTIEVAMWANTIDPAVLLEEKRIIRV